MKIFIQNMGEGLHHVEEEVNAENYQLSEFANFHKPMKVTVDADKFENAFRFKIRVVTEYLVACDRCLEEFENQFDGNYEQIYQVGGGEFSDEDENVKIVPADTTEIDISEEIYSLVYLSRPIKVVCSNDCKGLCSHCGQNLNIKKCNCEDNKMDPRWEKLKTFLKEE